MKQSKMPTAKHKFTAGLIIGTAELLTWIPLALFGLFLFSGAFMRFDLDFSRTSTRLAFDVFLSFCFFLQHSGMIRNSFQNRISVFVPELYHKALYAAVSGLLLLVLIFLWQPADDPILKVTGIPRWVLRAIFILSFAGFIRAGTVLNGLDTSGTKAIRDYLHGTEKAVSGTLTLAGPYRWVRHPLYFFTLLMIWSSPDITSDRLMFHFLWSAWILVGAILEERDLVETFGSRYRAYQKKVPMLIPTLRSLKRS